MISVGGVSTSSTGSEGKLSSSVESQPTKPKEQNKRIVADCSYAKNRIEKRNLNK